jgi:Helix-turn-helix domain of transposase family ISL3/zinc-finger of transposase IS204/IS1001/IS1096/IS1165
MASLRKKLLTGTFRCHKFHGLFRKTDRFLMRLLVSGATDTLRRHQDSPHLGILVVPKAGNSLQTILSTGLPWAADNAAFTGFDPAAFCAMLARLTGHPRCIFVACPDVVGAAAATLRLFGVWQPLLRELSLPVALVGQDGAEHLPLPWEHFQALFLGGSTEWKLGPGAARLAAEAKRRGCWVHLGRCNTLKRFRHAFRLDCDSVDGSGFSRWPDERIPTALRWLADLHGTPPPPRERRCVAHRFFREETTHGSLVEQAGWLVEGVRERGGEYRVQARHASEPAACLRCGTDARSAGTVYRHGILSLLVQDLPRGGRPVTIRVVRQRYRCRVCSGTFFQPLPGVCPHARFTEALAAYVYEQVRERTRVEVAQLVGVDEKTIRNLLSGRSSASS